MCVAVAACVLCVRGKDVVAGLEGVAAASAAAFKRWETMHHARISPLSLLRLAHTLCVYCHRRPPVKSHFKRGA